MSKTAGSRISFALACVLGFSLTGASVLANSATFDASLSDRPCDIVTPQMVATTFDVPEENLKQSEPMESWCSYELEEGHKTLEVILRVSVFDTNKAATKSFHDSTRSMSAEEMTEQLKALGVEFDESDIQFARDLGLPDPRPSGLQFEDVDSIAEQARFNTNEGSLYLLQDNLQITLNAFYGPSMTIPDKITSFEGLEKATSIWKEDTMDERKEQAIALAKVTLAAL